MIEAKDTVISWERIRMVLHEQDKKGTTDNMFRLEAIAEAQAEITAPIFFKAGQDSVFGSMPENLPPLLETAHRSGIREVVKGIVKDMNLLVRYDHNATCYNCMKRIKEKYIGKP